MANDLNWEEEKYEPDLNQNEISLRPVAFKSNKQSPNKVNEIQEN